MGKKKGKRSEKDPKPVKQQKKRPPLPAKPIKRSYEDDCKYLTKVNPTLYKIDIGFVPNMKVPAYVLVNNDLEVLLLEELKRFHGGGSSGGGGDTAGGCCSGGGGGFLPALKQVANVAALPGIVKGSFAMPDVHSGYGFCIGNVAAFDMDDPNAVVSPGGVGFDINCGVRLIRTNLMESDISTTTTTGNDGKELDSKREQLCQALFDHIPVGVGQKGVIPLDNKELDEVLLLGIDYCIKKGYAWPEDRDHCEENGRMLLSDPSKVTKRAKKRGISQLGTLGAGNHYVEIQVVEEIYNDVVAKRLGIGTIGQVCVMIHSGSRGLGHQVATDALIEMETAMARDQIQLNDRQLSCARIQSEEGQKYLAAMSAAANYAWANRCCLTYLARKAFEQTFKKSAIELDMHLVYDVSHNIAKVEQHLVEVEDADGKQGQPTQTDSDDEEEESDDDDDDSTEQNDNNNEDIKQENPHENNDGKGDNCEDDVKDDNDDDKDSKEKQTKVAKKKVIKTLLVHRKGSTRAFPPHHPLIPISYQLTGQPVLIGGTMGTCSYVLVGTNTGMDSTFGSTCHGAGRALSRNASRKKLNYVNTLEDLQKKGISIRVASPKLVTEEAPESYKNVIDVVDTCEIAGISNKVVKLRPIAVVKG